MRRKVTALAMVCVMAVNLFACQSSDVVVKDEVKLEEGEVALEKNDKVNPIAGNATKSEELIFGGDPSVLVDGDTVYLYTGHDTSNDDQVQRKVYMIREYLCYSTKDLKNWKSEGSVMQVNPFEVDWVTGSTSAWASQVVKHFDPKAQKDKYYLYYSSWDKTSMGKQSIGVAVADKPTGPFKDIGEPLVPGTLTESQISNWDDIDPTIWIEKDEKGEEHRYLGWGNSRFFTCELNEDMISVKDLNGDGKITYGHDSAHGDVLPREVSAFTEAPWFYRRQNEQGEYYGPYYLFYASGWREKMAYSTTDNLLTGNYEFGQSIMYPTTTSNTNHEAVFDFKGKTYFVYHNGSLPGGNGYRRSACIRELKFNEDGSVEPMQESTIGLTGTACSIEGNEGNRIAHANFNNATGDQMYPYKNVAIADDFNGDDEDSQWVLVDGKADESKAAYVSIQSENKSGLYITVNEDESVTLAQDDDATDETAKAQTFRTMQGLDSKNGVSFESVRFPGKYLMMKEHVLCLGDGTEKEASTFYVNKWKKVEKDD